MNSLQSLGYTSRTAWVRMELRVWVPGEGPDDAVGWIVGEAPGAEEERMGKPFVGPAGQQLDRALGELGITRGSLYLTNVVKSFPCDSEGRARTPTGEEVRSWLPDLLDEVQRFAGVPLLALGKTASMALTNRWRPGQCARGSVWVGWHPAYVLRRRTLFPDWLAQLAPWSRAVVSLATKREKGLAL